jgi:hypothetical protein
MLGTYIKLLCKYLSNLCPAAAFTLVDSSPSFGMLVTRANSRRGRPMSTLLIVLIVLLLLGGGGGYYWGGPAWGGGLGGVIVLVLIILLLTGRL